MKWLILFCVLSNSIEAAQDTATYDPTEVLLNVRKKVIATLERLPSYLGRIHDRSTLVPEIPKGTTVRGRIVRFERFHGPISYSLVVGIRLETIESAGRAYPFHARLATSVEGLLDANNRPGGLAVPQDLGSFDRMSGHDDPTIGFLQLEDVTRNYVIHRGLKMKGTTVVPHQ